MVRTLAVVMIMSVMLTGCRSMRYSMWETMGVHKRDLLKSNVEKARDEQEKASEQFTSALDQLRSLYGSTGSDLEKSYDRLQRIYNRSQAKAKDVTGRITTMDRVAEDLFKEWEQELQEITNAQLRADSASKLRDTRSRFSDLSHSMHESTRRMEPILAKLNDQVLYLKHNLNAQALGTLQGEAQSIQGDIETLIREMNQAIDEANAFIERL